jgi:H+/Cl- antiporter ClcA
MVPLVVGVGIASGIVGALYVGLLRALEHYLWPTHHSHLNQLAILVAVGAGVAIITRVLGKPGDVELLVNNIHVLGGNDDIRDLRSLIPVSLLCIAAGGAMGPEAPLVQTTGSLGSWLGRRQRLSVDDVRILTITGMAAGFTVLFGAPLGAALFALEILHRRGLEYYEALLPAIVGSLAGYAVYLGATGVGLRPIWHFPPIGTLRGVDLLWALGAGVGGAAIAVAFTYLSSGLRWLFGRIPDVPRPVVGGLVLGLLAIWSPYALTFAEAQIDPLVSHRLLGGALAVAFLAKLLGSTVTLSSGWRGGFIIPLFFMGVALGRMGHVAFPGSNESVLMAGCMVAACVGVTKTPIGSTLVVTEMAGLRLLPLTVLAALVALLLTSEVGLIHTQRDREAT